ncbi:MAG: methyl-accepting chemotaxis protein [Deltaproteobacteria bacterium]|nr:methyl-accepting chemotaxis protein [Deltaproteobacteria bacterium]
MLNKLKIRTKLMLLLGGFGLAFVGLGVAVVRTISDVQVGGDTYREITQYKDLVADILPPPMYVIEAYLESQLLAKGLEGPAFDRSVNKVAELHASYNDRHAFWSSHLDAGDLKSTFLQQAHEPAMRVFSLIESQLVPACRRHDTPEIAKALAEVSQAYEAHRQVVDRVVVMANAAYTQVETRSMAFVSQRHNTLLMASITVLVVLIVAGTLVGRSIMRPLDETLRLIKEVAEGDGDLTKRLSEEGNDELSMLSASFNGFMDQLHDIMSDVKNSAASLSSAAQRVSSSAEQISGGAQEQASSLEETAASLEQITSTVKQNSDNAQQAAQLASSSRNVAEQGGVVVSQAVSAMGEINRASKKIAEIITTIDEIAFQTNVLALNAAVEAARAGEQGRGFAVVATEVGNLSQRSAAAAKEIKALINDAVRLVDDGAGLVNRSGQTLTDIVVSVKRVTDIVGEIAAASKEQTAGVEQVNLAVTQMDSVTQTNAAETEALAETAAGLSRRASEMQMLVNRFKVMESSQAPTVSMDPPKQRVDRSARRRRAPLVSHASAHSRKRMEAPFDDAGISAMDRLMNGGGGDSPTADGFEEV